MILTNCAACAAPLALNAPRCVRCKTRYCDSTCQHDHWRRGHSGFNLANILYQQEHYAECLDVLQKEAPAAQRILGKEHEVTLCLQALYGANLSKRTDPGDARRGLAMMEESYKIQRRVLGYEHPRTRETGANLENARHRVAALAAEKEDFFVEKKNFWD